MMEQSKLISVIIAKLKIAYPYYFKELTEEEFAGLFSLYQEELENTHPIALLNTIKKIIKKSKFMPSIADILIEYKQELKKYYIEIINNSNFEDKKFLLDMIDWFSLHDDFPDNIPKNIISDISKLDYKNVRELGYKEVEQ